MSLDGHLRALCQTQTVTNYANNHKKEYVKPFLDILNLKEFRVCIVGLKSMAVKPDWESLFVKNPETGDTFFFWTNEYKFSF